MQFEVNTEDDEFAYLMASTMHDWDVCPLRESVHKDGVNSCPRYIYLLDMFSGLRNGASGPNDTKGQRNSYQRGIEP